MRLLTNSATREKADAIAAVLLLQSITSIVEEDEQGDGFQIWIREEDRVDDARRELSNFVENPNAAQYENAAVEARRILRQKQAEEETKRRKILTGTSIFRQIPGNDIVSGSMPPITLTLIILAVIASLLTDFMSPQPRNRIGTIAYDQLSFVSAKDYSSTKDPKSSIVRGEYWRAITPIFLHGFPLHLVFNCVAISQMGRLVERIEGSVRYTLLIVFVAILSNLLQGLMPAEWLGNPHFGGLSGVVYGVFSYLWISSLLSPRLGFRIKNTSIAIMLGWLLLGFTDMVGNIANLAHLGGLLAGAALAVIVAGSYGQNRVR